MTSGALPTALPGAGSNEAAVERARAKGAEDAGGAGIMGSIRKSG